MRLRLEGGSSVSEMTRSQSLRTLRQFVDPSSPLGTLKSREGPAIATGTPNCATGSTNASDSSAATRGRGRVCNPHGQDDHDWHHQNLDQDRRFAQALLLSPSLCPAKKPGNDFLV